MKRPEWTTLKLEHDNVVELSLLNGLFGLSKSHFNLPTGLLNAYLFSADPLLDSFAIAFVGTNRNLISFELILNQPFLSLFSLG